MYLGGFSLFFSLFFVFFFLFDSEYFLVMTDEKTIENIFLIILFMHVPLALDLVQLCLFLLD